jgi:glycosyltransferase involved in cell wall biosynthesis
VRREAEALTGRGDEVDFICLHEPLDDTVRVCNGVRIYPISVVRYRGKSILVYLFKYLIFFVQAFFLIAHLFHKRRYEIVQVHTMPDFMAFAALVPRMLGAKIILDVHDLMPELYMSKFGLSENHPLIRFITIIERLSIAFAHKAIAVHVPHRDALVRHGNPKEKFIVVLNLPDAVIFSRSENLRYKRDGKLRLVYHGTISRRHGIDVAFRAIALAKNQVQNIEFSVIGDGDDRQRLIALASEMGLSDHIRFSHGRVPLDELPARIKRADLGIVSILYDPFTRYMLPVKLMEYLRLGIPVIVSRTKTIETYFDDTMVRYFEPGNAKELANHIVDLYKNRHKRESLVSNAERFNRKFTWESQKAIYYDLMDSLGCKKILGRLQI